MQETGRRRAAARQVRHQPRSPQPHQHVRWLKSGIEALSGLAIDHVRVQYNSAKSVQINAHAYAQGSDINLAPAVRIATAPLNLAPGTAGPEPRATDPAAQRWRRRQRRPDPGARSGSDGRAGTYGGRLIASRSFPALALRPRNCVTPFWPRSSVHVRGSSLKAIVVSVITLDRHSIVHPASEICSAMLLPFWPDPESESCWLAKQDQ
jgi:hypothetical protein